MTKSRYQYSFALTGQDEVNCQTARASFKLIDIIRLGIKEALKQAPKPSKETIKRTKALVKA